MVETVECDQVQAPIASDNLLRRAMGAAAGEAAAAEEASRQIYRHEEPVTEVQSLPTLFLHGTPAEQAVPDTEASTDADVEETVLGVPYLPAAVTYVELDGPVDLAADLILARQVEMASQAETAVFEALVPEDVVSIVAPDGSGEDLVALVVEPVTEHEASPAVETVALEEQDVGAEAEVPALDTPAEETLASLADAMDVVVTQVGARAAARKPAKTSPESRAGELATKRKKAGKQRPGDAVWLTDALIWSQCGSWREFWLPPTDSNSSQRIEEFRMLAAAGKLKVWAKADGSEDWTPVTAAHWKKAGFDPLAFLAGRENAFSQAPAPKGKSKKVDDTAPAKEPPKYTSLMVSRAEVEALFSAASDETAAVA